MRAKTYSVNSKGMIERIWGDANSDDMVIVTASDKDGEFVQIEGRTSGYTSKEQRAAACTKVGKWLEDHIDRDATGKIVVNINKSEAGAEGMIVRITGDDAISAEEAKDAANLIGAWVGSTAEGAKPFTAEAAKAVAVDRSKAAEPEKKTAEPEKKTAEPEKKAAEPEKKADEPEKKAAPPKKEVHWDESLSVDENIDRLWGE